MAFVLKAGICPIIRIGVILKNWDLLLSLVQVGIVGGLKILSNLSMEMDLMNRVFLWFLRVNSIGLKKVHRIMLRVMNRGGLVEMCRVFGRLHVTVVRCIPMLYLLVVVVSCQLHLKLKELTMVTPSAASKTNALDGTKIIVSFLEIKLDIFKLTS